MTALLAAVFVASLAGSIHCAGMCGGFVAFYSGDESRRRRFLAHVAYNGGRLTTYAFFGMAAGFIGAAVDIAGSSAGLQRGAAIVAGLLIIAWGGIGLARIRGIKVFGEILPPSVQKRMARFIAALSDTPPVLRAFTIGLLTTFLPCGWLYAFVITAAGTGSPFPALAVMAAFWAGTVPMLLGLGVGVQALAAPLRRRVPAITAALLVVVGLTLVFGRFELIGAAPARSDESTVPTLEKTELPCCHGGD